MPTTKKTSTKKVSKQKIYFVAYRNATIDKIEANSPAEAKRKAIGNLKISTTSKWNF